LRALALRQYRVSHLGAHAAQEVGHLAGRDRARRGSGPGRCHVVRVVRAGHGSIPAPPPATTLRMALALTGRRPAGPLPGPQAGMGTEQSLAEGAGRTPGARSEHRSPPGLRWTRYPNNNSGPHSGCIHSGRSKTTQVGFSLGGRTRTMISGDAPDRISPGHGYRCCGGKWSRRRRCAQPPVLHPQAVPPPKGDLTYHTLLPVSNKTNPPLCENSNVRARALPGRPP